MKYRKYRMAFLGVLSIIVVAGLSACATVSSDGSDRAPASTEESNDGKEPGTMKGRFSWLDKVEEDFGKIASETSSRQLASENNQEILLKHRNWQLQYQGASNHFFVKLDKRSYKMIQTNLGDGESYAFAAEGQSENPVTLTLAAKSCNAELGYWNEKSRKYTKENTTVNGASCGKLKQRLRDYIP